MSVVSGCAGGDEGEGDATGDEGDATGDEGDGRVVVTFGGGGDGGGGGGGLLDVGGLRRKATPTPVPIIISAITPRHM